MVERTHAITGWGETCKTKHCDADSSTGPKWQLIFVSDLRDVGVLTLNWCVIYFTPCCISNIKTAVVRMSATSILMQQCPDVSLLGSFSVSLLFAPPTASNLRTMLERRRGFPDLQYIYMLGLRLAKQRQIHYLTTSMTLSRLGASNGF